MDKMVLVVDESGAKGYASTREKYEGEIGVMAGFLYPEKDIEDIKIVFDRIMCRYSVIGGGKFHITDLEKGAQESLREDVFFAFTKMKLRWFYTSVYAEGFHQSEFMEGRGGSKNKKESLHSVLFNQIFWLSLVMSASINKNNLFLSILTDNVDSGILKQFNKNAKDSCDLILGRERRIFKTVRNKESGEIKKHVAFSRVESDSLPEFEDIKYDIKCEVSSLTIAADILANSVNYYLRENQKQEVGKFVNNKEAIKNHPLVDLALVAENSNDVLPIIDTIYRRN